MCLHDVVKLKDSDLCTVNINTQTSVTAVTRTKPHTDTHSTDREEWTTSSSALTGSITCGTLENKKQSTELVGHSSMLPEWIYTGTSWSSTSGENALCIMLSLCVNIVGPITFCFCSFKFLILIIFKKFMDIMNGIFTSGTGRAWPTVTPHKRVLHCQQEELLLMLINNMTMMGKHEVCSSRFTNEKHFLKIGTASIHLYVDRSRKQVICRNISNTIPIISLVEYEIKLTALNVVSLARKHRKGQYF